MTTILKDTDLVSTLNETLLSLVRAVVTKPEAVSIAQSIHGPLVAMVIKTAPEDRPRVIGAKGKHFRALEAIIASLARQINRETHLAIDESAPRQMTSPSKAQSFNTPKDMAPVEKLLKNTVSMFMDSPDSVQVVRTDIGTTTIFEVRVKEENIAAITGPIANFDYGSDGLVIGSIKNLFDGIGKNHGRLIRVVLNKIE